MAINHYTSFSLLFLATATILLAHEARAAHGISRDLCRKTDFPALCRSVVKGATKPALATQFAIEALMSETKKAKSTVSKFGKNKFTNACNGLYVDAIDSLKTSLASLKSKDIGTLNSYLSASVTYYVTCDDTYKEAGLRSPLASTNKFLSQMADNCLALASLVH